MRILLYGELAVDGPSTGPGNYAEHLFRALVKEGIEVTFLSYFHDGQRYSLLQKLFGYTVLKRESGGSIIRAGIVPMVFMLMTQQFDLVHIVTFERSALLLLWSRVLRPFRLIYTEHGLLAFEHAKHRGGVRRRYSRRALFAERRILAAADTIIFVSALQERLHASRMAAPLNAVVIHPGVDDRFLHVSRTEHHPVRLLFVGGPARPEKGWDRLLQLLSTLSVPAVVTIVCDDTPDLPACSAAVSVRTVPKVSGNEYLALLADHDIFLSLSHHDSFSIAAAEAMAAGLVPIVTRSTGISELIVHGETGFIIDDGPATEVADILNQCVRDPSFKASIGRRARGRMREYRWEAVSSRHLSLYERVCHAP